MRLFGVPRAPAGSAQARLDADQIEDARSALAGRDRTFTDVGEVLAHAEGLVDGEALPVSVLDMRETWSVLASNRPYFGLTSTVPSRI